MRKTVQYSIASCVGGVAGFVFAESEKLLGLVLGMGIGAAILLFVHVYPRVGYAETRIERRD